MFVAIRHSQKSNAHHCDTLRRLTVRWRQNNATDVSSYTASVCCCIMLPRSWACRVGTHYSFASNPRQQWPNWCLRDSRSIRDPETGHRSVKRSAQFSVCYFFGGGVDPSTRRVHSYLFETCTNPNTRARRQLRNLAVQKFFAIWLMMIDNTTSRHRQVRAAGGRVNAAIMSLQAGGRCVTRRCCSFGIGQKL